VLDADVALLADRDSQIEAAEAEVAALLPRSPFATLTSVPGCGVVRVANYAAALGDPARWPVQRPGPGTVNCPTSASGPTPG
jgi:transposase